MNLTILPIEKCFFDPMVLVGLFIAITFLGFVIFVECYPLSDETWKESEIILIACSLLGVFGLVGDNRKFFYEREQSAIGCRIDTYKHRFSSVLDTAIYNRSFSTTLYSLEVIQEIENEYRTMCEWVLKNKTNFIHSVRQRESIHCDSIVFPKVSDSSLLSEIKGLKNLISEYNQLINEYQYYVSDKDEYDLGFYYDIFYPLFFVLGLSYSSVRYIGEYYNSKNRRKRNGNNVINKTIKGL